MVEQTGHQKLQSICGSNSTENLTQTVSDGGTITWRYEVSLTSNTFTGTWTETLSESSAVDCDPNSTISSSLGSCVNVSNFNNKYY